MDRASLNQRPRRNRKSSAIRDLIRETQLSPNHLIWPLFLVDQNGAEEPIDAMPGVSRLGPDKLVEKAKQASSVGIRAVALFPAIADSKKDSLATESHNKNGLVPTTIKKLKDALPDLLVITDVAMDPYSSDGHDGVVKDGKVLNDPTLEILAQMATVQADAGADIVAPSDMMDGRVGVIREALDQAGFSETSILAYTAKYASAFYGPFRDALDSAPRFGDKKTYQMDPGNRIEAIRELNLDLSEGADMVMVKPAMPYLDIIAAFKDHADVPVAAYQVSGEYAMLKSAAEKNRLDETQAMMESLLCIRRAGADCILTYFAYEAAKLMQGS